MELAMQLLFVQLFYSFGYAPSRARIWVVVNCEQTVKRRTSQSRKNNRKPDSSLDTRGTNTNTNSIEEVGYC